MVEREKIFFPQVGGMYGIKTCYFDRNSAMSLLVFFVEETLNFCVHLPDLTEVSETEKRLFHQDRGRLTP